MRVLLASRELRGVKRRNHALPAQIARAPLGRGDVAPRAARGRAARADRPAAPLALAQWLEVLGARVECVTCDNGKPVGIAEYVDPTATLTYLVCWAVFGVWPTLFVLYKLLL